MSESKLYLVLYIVIGKNVVFVARPIFLPSWQIGRQIKIGTFYLYASRKFMKQMSRAKKAYFKEFQCFADRSPNLKGKRS